jgi:MFS family permease/cell division septum initiation protein DivIVA
VDPALAAIVAEGFLSRLSFGLISFALPLYAYQRFGLSLAEIGVLASLNLAVAIALKPFMGALADRVGMKPSFTVAIAMRSVVSLLLAVATLPWQLFAIRGVHGVSISLRDPSANVLLAEVGGKKAVAAAFAWYQTAKSVAGAIGKASAGILLTLTASNFSLVFLIAFALSALPIFVVARYVWEPARETDDRAPRAETLVESEDSGAAAAAPRAPATLPFAGLGFLISGTAYMLANLFPIFAVEYAGLTEAQTGLIYLISIVVVLSGPVFGWLSDNVSRRLVLSVRGAANVLSSAVYLAAPNFAGVALGRAVDDVGKAAFRPAWGALMAQVAGFNRRRRARTMASLSAGEDAGEVAGPILAGLLWSTWGVPVLLGVRIGLAVATEVYAFALTRFLDPDRTRRTQARQPGVALHSRPATFGTSPFAGPQQKWSVVRLTPVEIQHQPLRRAWRGYDRQDVDKLLEHATASFEEVWRQRDELGTRLAELEAELGSFRESERLLSESLVTVQRFADELREEAKQEAERLARKAQSDQKRKKAAAVRELENLRADIERLRSLERDLRANLRTLLSEALSLVEDERADDGAPPDPALEKVLGAERAGAEDHG